MPVSRTMLHRLLLPLMPLLLAPLYAQALPSYSVSVLDHFGSSTLKINASGQVAGTLYPSFDARYAATVSQGKLTQFGTLGGSASYAAGINDSGSVTGVSELAGGATSHAFVSVGAGLQDLGTLGGAYSSGLAINNAGHVTGFADTANQESHAFLYSAGSLKDLGTLGGSQSTGTAINHGGMVAGYSTVAGDSAMHAFSYSGGAMSDLGTLGGADSLSTDINSSGQITGYSTTADGSLHAFLYSAGVMTDLGGLGGSSYSTAINDAGAVVGYTSGGSAFLYTKAGMSTLDSLIDQASGWYITSAGDINNLGQIVAYGTQDFVTFQALLLDPVSAVPEPATYAMLLLGLACVGRVARRRG